jgi:hypothetical protein
LILVISNIAIEEAPALVNLFPAGAASLVTASDFYNSFRAGISVDDFLSSSVTLGDKKIRVADIKGVITTIPAFLPVEFYFVKPEDRDYVCAETNAFFLYFLNELNCLKCNPPDWGMFVGGNVHKFEWAKIAASKDIPVLPYHFKNGAPRPAKDSPVVKCSIIFHKIMTADTPPEVQQYTRALAYTLKLSYLDCYFIRDDKNEYSLVHINTVPNISTPENRETIANYFIKTLL